MPEETRFVGNGPVALGGSQIVDVVSWEFKPEFKLDELQLLKDPSAINVPVNAGWTGSLKMEFAYTPRSLSAIAFGAWQGINVEEWGLDVEGNVEECTSPGDLWKVFQMTTFKWSMSAKKWQSTVDWRTFQTMFNNQLNAGQSVQCTTPYGNGAAYLGPLTFGADGKPASANIELRPALATFVSTNALVQHILTAANSVLQNGFATPLSLTLGYNPARSFGSGTCFVSKASFKGPVGKVTCDVEVQGTGTFNFA